MKQALGSLLALSVLLFPFGVYVSGECSAGGEDHVCAKLYGYVKLDASYDTRQIDVGNFARWVENTAAENGYLSITARQTRLGLSLKGPETESVIATGKIEFDLYGGGAENKNVPMMRHAFVKIWWKKLGLGLLAGQTGDVISPLVPSTVNYPVLWWCGNVGYRRPQLRVSKLVSAGKFLLSVDLAAARAIGAESEGEPIFQYRLGVKFPFLSGKAAQVGFSGHTGKESANRRTSSINIDVSLPVSSLLALKVEFWQGKNLAAYLGCIGQSLTTDVNGKGGWIAVSFGPIGAVKFNAGYGFDDPDDGDVKAGGGVRLKNSSVFANVFYSLNKAVVMAFEASRWMTEYVPGTVTRDAFRGQFSIMYKL